MQCLVQGPCGTCQDAYDDEKFDQRSFSPTVLYIHRHATPSPRVSITVLSTNALISELDE